MIFNETYLKGAYVIGVNPIKDERGFFARCWCRNEFEKIGLKSDLVQCNTSFNKRKGTLRGMHFQTNPYSENKLVRCTKGEIYDVIIDLRKESDTFGKWFGTQLSEENRRMLFVPEGFAHGYQTLTDNTEVFYQVTEFYHPEYEKGVRWNDKSFNISWPISQVIISEKDKSYGDFAI